MARNAGGGWLLVQFNHFIHPLSHGWHLMRRKEFRRVNGKPAHYNRIKDELGYTPNTYSRTFLEATARYGASPTREMAYDMLEVWREGVGKSVVAAWDLATFEAKGKDE